MTTVPPETQEVRALIDRSLAETGKLMAEQAELQRESGWHPFVAGAAFTLALTGLIAAAFKLFGH